MPVSDIPDSDIRVVLVEPSHAGNIGAVARAMKTMGMDRLHLVAPRDFPSAEATRRAAGADDVLEQARLHADLAAAVADCCLVVGTTARARSIEWPVLTPAQAADSMCAARDGPAALVFGRERCGLSNDEVDRCHLLVRIPANPRYPSLNLASAVQILAYEIRLRTLGRTPPATSAPLLADSRQMRLLYEHLQTTLYDLDFIKTGQPPTKLMRKLIRLFNRAGLSTEDINILRGILAAAQDKARRPC